MPRKNKATKHTPYTADHLFCVKKCFKNEKEAQSAAEFHMLEDMRLELSVYKCNMCKYWHLTRNIDNQQRI